jgi:hypothetical protein
MGEIVTTRISKLPKNIPNGRNIFQIVLNYTNIFHFKSFKNLPKLGFLVENTPSGNPILHYLLSLSPVSQAKKILTLLTRSTNRSRFVSIFSQIFF